MSPFTLSQDDGLDDDGAPLRSCLFDSFNAALCCFPSRLV